MVVIKIATYLSIFIILFHYSTRKYLNPYKLIMIFGKKGSGKTTTLTKIALTELKKGHPVYSTISIPGTILFQVENIGNMTFPPESVVLIDEVGMIWDSRDFKNFRPEVRDYFKLQRQYRNKVYLFSQTFDVDKKLRDLTDEMYLLKNFARVFSIQRRIIKRITINNASQNSSGVSSLVDEYKFDLPLFGGLKIVFVPRYVAYFASFNPKQLAFINGKYMDMNEVQKEYLSTVKWIRSMIKIKFLQFFTWLKKKFRKEF